MDRHNQVAAGVLFSQDIHKGHAQDGRHAVDPHTSPGTPGSIAEDRGHDSRKKTLLVKTLRVFTCNSGHLGLKHVFDLERPSLSIGPKLKPGRHPFILLAILIGQAAVP